MGGDAHDPRDQVGVDPTEPATTEGGDAHEPTLDSEHSHGTAGAHVTGPATDPHPVAGPPDLDHAIQAVADALWRQKGLIWSPAAIERQARLCVEAAAPVLLQATRDRLADLEEAARAILETDGSYGQMVEAEIRLRAALDGPAAQEVER